MKDRHTIPTHPEPKDMTRSMKSIYKYWINLGATDLKARRLAALAFTDNKRYLIEKRNYGKVG